jgi:hypothetical protein
MVVEDRDVGSDIHRIGYRFLWHRLLVRALLRARMRYMDPETSKNLIAIVVMMLLYVSLVSAATRRASRGIEK